MEFLRFVSFAFISFLLSSCCLPLSPLAACYIPPSNETVMSIIKNAEYTPFEAYTFLCNKIETEHSEYFYYLGFPYPRFSIINGLYFFPVRQYDKLSCVYAGWEFNQSTGMYRFIYKPYMRLYIDCYTNSREYVITKETKRLISLEEWIKNDNLPERDLIKDVLSTYLEYVDKMERN